MKSVHFRKAALTLVFSLLTIGIQAQSYDKRTIHMGSSLFSIPTGYTQSAVSYITDDSHSMMLISQQLLGRFLEVSMLRHMNGDVKGKNIFNFKLNILEEDLIIPNIVWGISDFKSEFGSKISYFAASKSLDMFGCKLHAGICKDPDNSKQVRFFGAEKAILPLVAVAAERIEDKNTIGLKMNPYPGVTIEYARRVKSGDHRGDIYKLNYVKSF